MKYQKFVPRVDRREFLNLPGHHYNATINAYVEDTSEVEVCDGKKDCEGDGYGGWKSGHKPHHREPKIILEISDCSNRISLEFEITSPNRRQNAFHKIDTLISSLVDFREGLVEECRLYKDREAEIERLKEEKEEPKKLKLSQLRSA